jgi:hypothetical protein
MANRDKLFDLLFASAAETLLELGRDRRWLGAQLGITSLLHAWTRELLFQRRGVRPPIVSPLLVGPDGALAGRRGVPTFVPPPGQSHLPGAAADPTSSGIQRCCTGHFGLFVVFVVGRPCTPLLEDMLTA